MINEKEISTSTISVYTLSAEEYMLLDNRL